MEARTSELAEAQLALSRAQRSEDAEGEGLRRASVEAERHQQRAEALEAQLVRVRGDAAARDAELEEALGQARAAQVRGGKFTLQNSNQRKISQLQLTPQ